MRMKRYRFLCHENIFPQVTELIASVHPTCIEVTGISHCDEKEKYLVCEFELPTCEDEKE